MKKLMTFVVVLVVMFALAGCYSRSMNYIINNEPNMTGIVLETDKNGVLMTNENGKYWVSLDVENKDSMTDFRVGDEIVVYFDGMVAESSPMQINKVYAITLKTPADRAVNDQS